MKKNLSDFTIEELEIIKTEITKVKSQEELIETIDKIITRKQEKTEKKEKSYNEQITINMLGCFLPTEEKILEKNGIYTLADLVNRKTETISEIGGSMKEKVNWARDFFDMTAVEDRMRIIKERNKRKQNQKQKTK